MKVFGFAGHALRIQKIEQFLHMQSPALAALDLTERSRIKPSITAHLADDTKYEEDIWEVAPLPPPATPRTQPENIINEQFVADAQEHLRATTSRTSRYGSGATPDELLPRGTIHGEQQDAFDCVLPPEIWSECGTPRRAASPAPLPTPDREPIWGRQYLGFTKRMADIEKQHQGLPL